MTNKQILEKAIKKAVKSEWKSTLELKWVKNLKENQLIDPTGYCQYTGWIYQLIFSHDFAKAFWGKEWVDGDFGNTHKEYKQKVKMGVKYAYNYVWNDNDLSWGFHLKHMVLQEEPLKYIEKFL